MSACPSSPISVISARPGWTPWDPEAVPVDLLAALAGVPDPRARRGVRHGLVSVLAIGVCAVLAGARTFTAIAEWAQDLTGAVRPRLGLGRRAAPSESTIRRTLQGVEAEALDRAVSAWLVARSATASATPAPATPTPATPGPAGRVIAIDGKSARGARGSDGRATHLLAAFDQASGVVLGQTVVAGKTNEINAFAPLLNRIDITGAIFTADTLCRGRHKASYGDVLVMPTCRPEAPLGTVFRAAWSA